MDESVDERVENVDGRNELVIERNECVCGRQGKSRPVLCKRWKDAIQQASAE